MNLRKFISGISALAIAASTFAGLAVTANAAFSNVEKTTAATTVTDGNITVGLGVGDSITDGVISYSGASVKETSSKGYASVDDTKRYFIVTAENNGNIIFTVKFTGRNNRVFYAKVEDPENLVLSTYKKATNNEVVGGESKNSLGTTETQLTLSNVKAGESYIFYGYQNSFTVKDIAVKSPVESITVNFKSDDTLIKSQNIDVTGKYIGDTLTYYAPAYIDDEANKTLYQVTGLGTENISNSAGYQAKYSKSLTLSEAVITDTINCQKVDALDNVYQFIDFDETSSSARAQVFSSGKVTKISDIQEIEVKADGVYTITSIISGTANSAYGKAGTLNLNGEEIGKATYYNAQGKINIEGKSLKSGDKLTFTAEDSNVAADYLLIVKTADLPEETATTASARTEAYAGTVGDGINAVASYFTATTGTDTKTSITVAIDGADSQTKALPATTNTNVVLGILISAPETLKSVDDLRALMNSAVISFN